MSASPFFEKTGRLEEFLLPVHEFARETAPQDCQRFLGLFYLHNGLDNRSIPDPNKAEQVNYGVVKEYREEPMTFENP